MLILGGKWLKGIQVFLGPSIMSKQDFCCPHEGPEGDLVDARV